MSILRTHIKQKLDIKKVNLVQAKLSEEVIKHFDKVSNQIEHLTFQEKLDLVNKGYMIPIDSYYLKIKEFISNKSIEKELEKKLQTDFYKNLPEESKTSCANCEKLPQIERSCEYYNIQLQYFLIFSAAIIYDEIRRFEKEYNLHKDLKESIAIEYLKSITISPEGFGFDLGKLIEMLIDNELYQTTIELGREDLEDRYKICLDNLKELKDIEKYAKWKIKDGLIFNKWTHFWAEENRNVKEEIDYLSKFQASKSLSKSKVDSLLEDLLEIAQRILSRKGNLKIHEDRINDNFTDFLENKGYTISDQKRIGNGRVDIAVKNETNTTLASIEATKFHSPKTIEEHLHKLLHRYNSTGNRSAFLLVYSFEKLFSQKWKEYNNIVNKINYGNWEHPIINQLFDLSSKKEIPLNLKLGVTEHSWHNSDDNVKVYHVFINAY